MMTIRLVIVSLLLLLSAESIGRAQVQRTFVSGLGSDANVCSRIAPCRTFGQAISQTNAGGEVVVLDSAGYGPFAIAHAVSIIAPPGVYAGISVFSGDGIGINAGAGDTVILRGLTVNSQGTSGMGIDFLSGGVLHVEDCVVNGFSATGISFGAAGNLEVKDSILRGNALGIHVQPSSGTALATIDQTRLEGGSSGLVAGGGLLAGDGSKVTARNCVASGAAFGFVAITSSAGSAELNLESCVAANSPQAGVLTQSTSSGTALIRISDSTVTDNLIGLQNIAGPGLALLLSRGNNTVEGNTTNTSGTIGSYTAK